MSCSLPAKTASAIPSRDAMRHTLWRTEWRSGQLRQWWMHGNAEQRDWIRQLAPEMFPYFGARALRQFH